LISALYKFYIKFWLKTISQKKKSYIGAPIRRAVANADVRGCLALRQQTAIMSCAVGAAVRDCRGVSEYTWGIGSSSTYFLDEVAGVESGWSSDSGRRHGS